MLRYIITISIVMAKTTLATNDSYIFIDKARELCPLLSFCTQPSFKNDSVPSYGRPNCHQCGCKQSCFVHNNCCPDVQILPDERTTQVKCISPVFNIVGKNQRQSQYGSYNVFASCPVDNGDVSDEVRHMCEYVEANPARIESFNDIVFVSDVLDHGVIYKNSYCAICNGVKEFKSWSLKAVECFEDLGDKNWYTLQLTGEELLNFVLYTCTVFSEPSGLTIPESSRCMADSINTCPDNDGQTDQWLVEACKSSYYPAIRHWKNGRNYWFEKYWNIFCFMCNNPNSSSLADLPFYPYALLKDRTVLVDYITAILNLNANIRTPLTPKRTNQCMSNEIYDIILGKCRSLFCDFGKVPVSGECHTGSFTLNATTLIAGFKIFLSEPIKIRSDDYRTTAFLGTLVKRLFAEANISACDTCINDIGLPHSNDSLFDNFYIHKGIGLNDRCSLTDISSGLATFIPKGGFNETVNGKQMEIFVSVITKSFNEELSFFSVTFCYQKNVQILPDMFYCPHVRLSLHEYADYLQKLPITFQNQSREGLLPGFYEVLPSSEVPETIAVCVSKYFSYPSIRNSDQSSQDFTRMVPLVLTSVSMVCIIILLLMMTKRKRRMSMPVFLYVLTACNLLLAQGLHQFGIGWPELGVGCFVIGICIHYFWLSSMLSMSCYCFVLMQTISNLNSRFEISIRSYRFINTLVLCYISPVLFVIGNVIASSIIDSTRGYGSFQYCFIDLTIMRWLLFALPMIILMFLNIIFFLVIVYKLKATSQFLQSQAIDRSYLNVYVRLSTLTGAAWIFGFIYELVNISAFKYLFEVFTAGQGLFMLLAFSHRKIRSVLTKIKQRVSSITQKAE